MGVDSQQRDLEGRVERLSLKVDGFARQLSDLASKMWQAFGSLGSGGGSTGLVRLWLPTGIASGSFGSPGVATDAIAAVRSGNGYTTSGGTTGLTAYNTDTTAIGPGKAAWGQPRGDGSFDILIGDC